MSIGKLISANVIIDEFLEFSEESANFIPMIHRWIKRASFNIGSEWNYEPYTFSREVVNGRVELPDSAVHVTGIMPGDFSEDARQIFTKCYSMFKNEINDIDGQFIYYWNPVDGRAMVVSHQWEVQNNNIVFEMPFNYETVTVDIIKKETDKDGFILVNESNIEAILAYVELMMTKKITYRNFKRNRITGPANQYIESLKREYNRLVRRDRAEEGEHNNHIAEISRIINHPIKGFGNVFTSTW